MEDSPLLTAIRITDNEILIRRRKKMISEIENDHCKECDKEIVYCNRCEHFKCLVSLNEKVSQLEKENDELLKEQEDEVQYS